MSKQSISTRRIVMDAVLIALFYVISLLKIPPEGSTSAIKITFEMLPVLLAALTKASQMVFFGEVQLLAIRQKALITRMEKDYQLRIFMLLGKKKNL